MHLLARDTTTLDDAEAAVDLGHMPADLVVLSFTDSDLAAVAAGWQAMDLATRPTLRLASLARLRHPMSVDLYVERVIAGSRCVVLRLLGGMEYWRYGAEEVAAACRARGVPLAMLPGCSREDPRLAELSTVAPPVWRRLDAMLREGGPRNVAAALRLASHLAGLADDDGTQPAALPACGEHRLGLSTEGSLAAIVFYRTHLLALDIAPVEALAQALAARGMGVRALFVASLKDADAARIVRAKLAEWRPSVVLNLTAFSARAEGASPLDVADAPVLQVVLSGSALPAWQASSRGLSATDLAMQVVLPELDGRLLTTAISFKAAAAPVPGLDFARVAHVPDADGVALAADRAAGWSRLRATPPAQRRVAIVLSDYPGGGGQVAHAVGLDSLASLESIRRLLDAHGYAAGDRPFDIVHAEAAPTLSLAEYRRMFATLPGPLREAVAAAWGEPEGDFTHRYVTHGHMTAAIQPDRGHRLDRRAGYHDADLPPCHAYVAFYLWLARDVDALVHLGTHGTLEWLPGKAAAVSAACAPAALLRGLPVVYPFIVNNPGEAAVAKRRLGAVTIGHLTPPLQAAGSHGAARELELLIDEYASADGLDARRTGLLRRDILERAEQAGLLAEAGARALPDDDALARLDAYLCDVKALQIRDGLHVFGQMPDPPRRAALLQALRASAPGFREADLDASPAAENAALLAALDGRMVAPGPAGAPSRGRADVLPTGRNLFTVDPRAIPTRSAVMLAEKAATALLLRHTQEHGDWPRSLVIDLWGSSAIRTGGEDLALALVLLGARPVWDAGSARVTGIEVLPIALLDRPRVDVTLRISGLFRDAFAGQIALFDGAVQAVAARDEAPDWNPLAHAGGQRLTRVFGPAPGRHGAGIAALLERGAWSDRDDLGATYLAAGGFGYGAALDGEADAAGWRAAVARAAAFVHTQDHREIDLLDSPDFAAHSGGFAAAAASLGSAPAIYHADTGNPDAPRIRGVAEELARVVRGRAANPAWIAGMMRHGYRGAAEIARSLDSLFAFAATLPTRLDAQFDLLFDATLGDAAVAAFLLDANPDARAAMAARFGEARARDLWRGRRNSVAAVLAQAAE